MTSPPARSRAPAHPLARRSKFGFTDYEINLSTRPEKSVGSDDIWAKAEGALKGALDRKGWSYVVDEGGGAFYGPKIDLKLIDCLDRKWQCSTVQCDFNLPERFDLMYKVRAEGGAGGAACHGGGVR